MDSEKNQQINKQPKEQEERPSNLKQNVEQRRFWWARLVSGQSIRNSSQLSFRDPYHQGQLRHFQHEEREEREDLASGGLGEELKRQTKTTNSVSCGICGETCNSRKTLVAKCDDIWCGKCLSTQFEIAVKDETKYPASCCNQELDFAIALELFSTGLAQEYAAAGAEYSCPQRKECIGGPRHPEMDDFLAAVEHPLRLHQITPQPVHQAARAAPVVERPHFTTAELEHLFRPRPSIFRPSNNELRRERHARCGAEHFRQQNSQRTCRDCGDVDEENCRIKREPSSIVLSDLAVLFVVSFPSVSDDKPSRSIATTINDIPRRLTLSGKLKVLKAHLMSLNPVLTNPAIKYIS
ncbi:unnamed protein product [Aureobasidium pullulans]|nr:unnamed protein product [Aureobasidium pullulans]